MEIIRCGWCGKDPIYQQYHDQVWGRAVYDCRELFAKLCLDGQQAGLSWITILKRQSGYENAFANFDPHIIAEFDDAKVEELMQDVGIIRNRLKINSIITNARALLAYEEKGGDFSELLWSFVGGKTIINNRQTLQDIPAITLEAEAMSKALIKLGFKFVGPTICYAFMQAVGMVNDHIESCHCYQSCVDAGAK